MFVAATMRLNMLGPIAAPKKLKNTVPPVAIATCSGVTTRAISARYTPDQPVTNMPVSPANTKIVVIDQVGLINANAMRVIAIKSPIIPSNRIAEIK